jgi:ribosomal protein S27E
MAANLVTCPSCGKKYKIPASSEATEFACTGCGENIELEPAAPAGGSGGGRRRAAGVRERRRQAEARRGGTNTGLYIVLGGVGVVAIVVAVLAFSLGGKEPLVERNQETATTEPEVREPKPPVRPKPAKPEEVELDPDEPDEIGEEPDLGPPPRQPEPEPREEPREDPSEDLRYLSWPEIQKKLRELPHHEDTSGSVRAEIDRLMPVLLDFQSGGDGLKAKDRLVEIGKAAVPALLKGTANLDFAQLEDRSAGQLIDEALREITGNTRGMALKVPIDKVKVWQRTFKYHLVYWETHKHLEGDKFRTKSTVEEDEEEDL